MSSFLATGFTGQTHCCYASNQLVNQATSSPADDVHHDVIPSKLLLTNRVYIQQTSGIHAPVEKEKAVLYPVEVPPP
jgi:hypothetical protein